MKTIIYTHPDPHSFNHAILTRLCDHFTATAQPFAVIDLYQDHFDPRLTPAELQTYAQGQALDPLVERYQTLLAASDELLLIFPIWWHQMPAMLKGFFDKVLLPGFAFAEDPNWRGLLPTITKASVITTAGETKAELQARPGDPIQTTLINGTFADIGIAPGNCQWLHFGRTGSVTDTARQQFLAALPQLYQQGQ
ncbi:NAD(P)H-dependent oxidoreductase [Lacticaseibacillus baoqingensis]|uniref:NAD(P)H-dependent oxidoreductase n=1 Tax=Lacticaseibacillus baoqingensis TaxID=2486013 RepID=A0ABW4E8B5_9LACO|nr:NAD(P)H-dependent oxidoreductase [Lacticaseibacillus baoqingensis]